MVNAGSKRPKALTMLALAGTASAFSMCQPKQPEVVAYVQPPQIYCYETLARPDCYAEPLPDGYGRMIGFYGPRPAEMPPQQPATLTTGGPAPSN
jgi:hypothetical protein